MNRRLLSLLVTIGTAAVVLAATVVPVRSLGEGMRKLQTAGHAVTPRTVFAAIPQPKAPAKVEGEAPDNVQEVPFTHTLGKNEQAVTGLYVVVDANGDTKTWKPGGFTGYSVCMKPTADDVSACDDWLISPPVHLEAGKEYRFSLDCGRTLTSGSEELVEVKIGAAQTVAAMTADALPMVTVTNRDFETYDNDFTVEEDGYYYLGIHCVSEKAKSGNLKICNLSVKEATPRVAPAAAGTLTYEPGEKGSLEFTCHYTAPTTDVDGEAIDAISKVEIKTNWVTTHEFADVAPGETIDFTTTLYNNGNNKIEAIAYRYDIPGEVAIVDRIFAGPDDPKPVTGLQMTVSDDYKHVTLTWDPVSEVGSHGGWVDPSEVVYYIFDAFGSYYDPALLETTETTATFDYTDMEGQDFVAFQVTAGVGYYYSDAVSTSIAVVGDADVMPWTESFSNAYYEQVWAVDPESSYSGIRCGTVYDNELQINADDEEAEPVYLNSQDDDNGFFFVLPYEKDAQYGFFSGRIDISGASNPVLEFWYQGQGSAIDVMVARGDCNFETIRTIDLKEEPTEGWTLCRMPLDAYKDCGAVQMELRVRAIHNTDETTWSVPIDNIRIRNLVDYNVTVQSVKAPATVKAGEDVSVAVTVVNNGLQSADGVTVEWLCDGKVADETKLDALEPDGKAVVTYSYPTDRFSANMLTPGVRLVWDDDMDVADNEAKTTVSVEFPPYPAATGVEAVSADPDIVLSWEAPEYAALTAPRTRVEDFESDSYEPLTNSDFGGWMFLDIDGGKTYTFLNDSNNPYRTTPMAFQLYNPVTAGVPDSYLADIPPHSGDNLLVGWSTNGLNDNWLISPELSGNAQTVTFWGRSFTIAFPEAFEVYYSLGGTAPEDFVKVEAVANYPEDDAVPEVWTEFSFDVPEGACRFAVRHVAYDSYALYLDDFTFEAAGELPATLAVEGYDVYRDGVKVNDGVVEGTTYTDANVAAGTYTYNVVAVYNLGEARVSAPVTVAHYTTGVASAAADGGATISVADGCIVVSVAESAEVAVSAVNGVVLFKGTVTGEARVPAAAGVYMVKAGQQVSKVVVK